jgi:hypothetical protein
MCRENPKRPRSVHRGPQSLSLIRHAASSAARTGTSAVSGVSHHEAAPWHSWPSLGGCRNMIENPRRNAG